MYMQLHIHTDMWEVSIEIHIDRCVHQWVVPKTTEQDRRVIEEHRLMMLNSWHLSNSWLDSVLNNVANKIITIHRHDNTRWYHIDKCNCIDEMINCLFFIVSICLNRVTSINCSQLGDLLSATDVVACWSPASSCNFDPVSIGVYNRSGFFFFFHFGNHNSIHNYFKINQLSLKIQCNIIKRQI